MMILKIGGSAITVKDASKPTIDTDNLNRVVDEIQSYSEELIIVHGAGSYGHIYAKEYEIGQKIKDDQDLTRKRLGSCITQSSVQELNNIFCKALQEKGIPAIGLQPSSLLTMKDKRIDICNIDIIKKYLNKGFIPVLYGDSVLD